MEEEEEEAMILPENLLHNLAPCMSRCLFFFFGLPHALLYKRLSRITALFNAIFKAAEN